jgi:hypothetical protein
MKNAFGGSLLVNKRKQKRPLDFDKPTHLVLRLKPNIVPLFDPRDLKLRAKFFALSEKYDLKLYDLIFNHSHVHGAVKISNRVNYTRFIRELTSWIVGYFSRLIGFQYKNMFAHRPFTRIATWGRGVKQLMNYLRKNEVESQTDQKEMNEKMKCRTVATTQLTFAIGPLDTFRVGTTIYL